jgi:threonine/homoserine/homoserine lactone efflux protein
MVIVICFLAAFFFSFIGSIPPGTINLTVIQMGLNEKFKDALWFSVAAGLIEYPYAWIAIAFEKMLTASPWVNHHIQLLTGIVLVFMGILGLWPSSSKPIKSPTMLSGGFAHGIILSILNPLAVPYWIGMTAYLKQQDWIDLSTPFQLHAFLFGVALGSTSLLIVLIILSKNIASSFATNPIVKKAPAVIMLLLGVYSLLTYIVHLE